MTLIVRTNVIGNKGAHDKHVKFIDTERTEQVNLSEGTLSSLSDGSLLLVKAKTDSPTVYRNQELRSNLTRNLTNRDPFFYYQIDSVLGVGSMGSVAKVHKRPGAIGGSARSEIVDSFKREKKMKDCLNFPLLGGLFQYCMRPNLSPSNSQRDLLQPQSTHSICSSSGGRYQVSYALKSIHLTHVTDPSFVEELKNEIEILKTLDHPHIVRPIEVYQYRNQLFIVMELCSGGDLYTRDPYTEEDAARIVSCILSAVTFMHAKGVIHRDLKYENIMFVNSTLRSEIKIIDFGLSKKYSNDKTPLTEGVGTIYTMAPEVLKGTYTSQADIWSIGVITYMLLSSQMPFYGRERCHIIEQIMKCEFDFKGRRWKRVSPQAKAFVEDLLVLDPDDRVTGDCAFGSNWLNRRFATTVRGPTDDELDTIIKSFQKFIRYSRLKKLALMVIAHKSTTEEIGILRKVFDKFDTKKKGQLVFEEFSECLKPYGFSNDDLINLFVGIDLDGTGIIRYTEFLAAAIETQGFIDEGRLAEAFDCLDSDDSGFISVENLAGFLGDQIPINEISRILKESSLTAESQVSYPEFLALWDDRCQPSYEGIYASNLSKPDYNHRSSVPSTVVEVTSNMQDESESEVSSLARANYLDVKMCSQRKLEKAQKIEVNDALKIIFDEKPEPIMAFEHNNLVVKTMA